MLINRRYSIDGGVLSIHYWGGSGEQPKTAQNSAKERVQQQIDDLCDDSCHFESPFSMVVTKSADTPQKARLRAVAPTPIGRIGRTVPLIMTLSQLCCPRITVES